MYQHSNSEIQELVSQIQVYYAKRQYDNMLLWIHRLETLSESLGNIGGLGAVRYYLSTYKRQTAKKSHALVQSLEAISFCTEHQLHHYAMHAHNSTGIIYEDMSDYASSLDHYIKALRLANQFQFTEYMAYLLVNIGNLFMVLSDYDTALPYLIQGYEHFAAAPHLDAVDRVNMIISILNVLEAYTVSGNDTQSPLWEATHHALLGKHNRLGISGNFVTVSLAHACSERGDYAEAERLIVLFLDCATDPECFDDYYTMNLCLYCLSMALDMGNRPLSEKLLHAIADVREKITIDTFDYRTETLRIRYYECFFSSDPTYLQARQFFFPYYQHSQYLVDQLRKTYANSLLMRTELDKVKDEHQSALELTQQLQKSVDLDPFTEVYNKMSVEKHIAAQLAQSVAADMLRAILLIDIDRFKSVNDTFGHQVGDQVIASLASLLRDMSWHSDVVGRLGGDEFVVFIASAYSETFIREKVEVLSQRMRDLPVSGTGPGGLTLSIGIYFFRAPEPYASMVAKADAALYQAKNNGRAQYYIYQNDSDETS